MPHNDEDRHRMAEAIQEEISGLAAILADCDLKEVAAPGATDPPDTAAEVGARIATTRQAVMADLLVHVARGTARIAELLETLPGTIADRFEADTAAESSNPMLYPDPYGRRCDVTDLAHPSHVWHDEYAASWRCDGRPPGQQSPVRRRPIRDNPQA